MKYLINSDLDIVYSYWKSKSKNKFFLLPPLRLDCKLQGIQIKSNSVKTRFDFMLIDKQSVLMFKDLNSGSEYKFELMNNNKITLTGKSDLKEYWIKQPIEDASNWL